MFSNAETDLNKGLPSGPLKGVPFLLKDLLVSYSGVPTSCGSRLFEGWIREYDSEILKRWRNAGLVIIGKTNTPELGASGSTEPIVNGPTHNPWKFGYSTGGSSGGSAAAVAAARSTGVLIEENGARRELSTDEILQTLREQGQAIEALQARVQARAQARARCVARSMPRLGAFCVRRTRL